MRHAMSNRIFQEVEPEVVSHTAASKMLAEDQSMMDWVGVCVEECWPVRCYFKSSLWLHCCTAFKDRSQTKFL